MTWTCTKCQNVNPVSECKCLRIGCDGTPWKTAGLSEEERAAWEAYRKGHQRATPGYAMCSVEDAHASARMIALDIYRAARAQLEAELKTLRERHARELGAMHMSADKLQEANDDLEADNELAHKRIEELEAQLAQAQKPAAPVGLPEVDRERAIDAATAVLLEYWSSKYVDGTPVDGTDACKSKATKIVDAILRLPPAQTSQEPMDFDKMGEQMRRAEEERHPPFEKPAASPPGEVSTENLERVLGKFPVTLDAAKVAAVADIRANLERETAKWDAERSTMCEQIAHLEQRVNDLEHEKLQAAKNKTRIAELTEESRHTKACFDEAIKQRDAALVEVERLKEARSAWQAASGRIVEYLEPGKKCAMATAEETERVVCETVERLRGGELGQATAAKRCPADGMSDIDVGQAIYEAWCEGDRTVEAREHMGAKARELFTPVSAQPGRKVEVGDTVWTSYSRIMRKPVDAGSAERATVTGVSEDGEKFSFESESDDFSGDRWLADLDKTWWWSDPSKGAE